MNELEKLNKEEIKNISGGDDTTEEEIPTDRHFVCPICHWRFSSSIMLSAHMRSAHPNAQPDPEESD